MDDKAKMGLIAAGIVLGLMAVLTIGFIIAAQKGGQPALARQQQSPPPEMPPRVGKPTRAEPEPMSTLTPEEEAAARPMPGSGRRQGSEQASTTKTSPSLAKQDDKRDGGLSIDPSKIKISNLPNQDNLTARAAEQAVQQHLKRFANDPKVAEIVEIDKPEVVQHWLQKGRRAYTVRATYRDVTPQGGRRLFDYTYLIEGGKVLQGVDTKAAYMLTHTGQDQLNEIFNQRP